VEDEGTLLHYSHQSSASAATSCHESNNKTYILMTMWASVARQFSSCAYSPREEGMYDNAISAFSVLEKGRMAK
jgi:hypothetical protein